MYDVEFVGEVFGELLTEARVYYGGKGRKFESTVGKNVAQGGERRCFGFSSF